MGSPFGAQLAIDTNFGERSQRSMHDSERANLSRTVIGIRAGTPGQG